MVRSTTVKCRLETSRTLSTIRSFEKRAFRSSMSLWILHRINYNDRPGIFQSKNFRNHKAFFTERFILIGISASFLLRSRRTSTTSYFWNISYLVRGRTRTYTVFTCTRKGCNFLVRSLSIRLILIRLPQGLRLLVIKNSLFVALNEWIVWITWILSQY